MAVLCSKSQLAQILGVSMRTFSNKTRLFIHDLGGEVFKKKRLLSPKEAIKVLGVFNVEMTEEQLDIKLKEIC
jgi:hypothetical protein